MVGQRTPHHDFVVPILSVLASRGGSARTTDVYSHIERTLAFNERDQQTIDNKSPEPYWKNQTRVAALRMRENGLLLPSETHGVWEISKSGRLHLASTGYALNVHAEENESPTFSEGHGYQVLVNRYERNQDARKHCIDHYGCRCQVCAVKLSDVYGDVAENVIQVHHLVPIADIGHEYSLDPIRDLRPVCPNCHTIIHLRTPPFTIHAAKQLLNQHCAT